VWVACHSGGFAAIADDMDVDVDVAVARRRTFYPDFSCSALATVPGLGLVVRHRTGVQFFATPDAIAMAAMSSCKVAWMAAVCRGLSR